MDAAVDIESNDQEKLNRFVTAMASLRNSHMDKINSSRTNKMQLIFPLPARCCCCFAQFVCILKKKRRKESAFHSIETHNAMAKTVKERERERT